MMSWLRKRKAEPLRYPPGPEGLVIYAIGDIHGRLDCLQRVQRSIDLDPSRQQGLPTLEVYLGDYIDRGPQSPAVLDNLIDRARNVDVVALLGNHEAMMMSVLNGDVPFSDWRAMGGLETAMAYGVPPQRLAEPGELRPEDLAPHVSQAHLAFLSSLPAYHAAPPYCFVHAGLRPGVPLERQRRRDLTWIRDEFLSHGGPFGYVVVHGHTPVREIDFRRHRINIDTGAYLTNRLSVVRIDEFGVTPLEGGNA